MALIEARHPVYGVCLIPETRLALHPEWERVEAPKAAKRRTTKTRPSKGAQEPTGDGGNTTENKE